MDVYGMSSVSISEESANPTDHQQCHVNYREIRRATVWSYEFHRRIDGRVPPAEGTRPYEKLTIPTDLAIVHITLMVGGKARPSLRGHFVFVC